MGLQNIHTDYFSCPEVSYFVLLCCTNKSAHQRTKSLCLWITLSSHLICLCWLPALAPPLRGIHWLPLLSLSLCFSLSHTLFCCMYSKPLVSCSILFSIFTLILSMFFLHYLEKKHIMSCQHIIHPLKQFVFLSAITLYSCSYFLILNLFLSSFYFSFVNELCVKGICLIYLFLLLLY